MIIHKIGEWKEAQELLKAGPERINKALKKAIAQEGLHFTKLIKQNIQKGLDPPLKSAGGGRDKSGRFLKTGRKGGSKPLIATGDLLGSITSITSDNGLSAFVGIPRAARGHQGQVVRLAAIHEFGATIVVKITEKMRRFLFGVLFKDKKPKGTPNKRGFLIIHIPARPFVRPAFEEGAKGAAERFIGRLAKLLGGKYGGA